MPISRFAALLLAPLIYLSIVVTVAALVAYGVHLMTLGALNFSLVVSRGAQIVLLLSLIPLGRALGLQRADIGLPGNSRLGWKQLLWGLGIGIAILSVHVTVMIQLQIFKPNPAIRPTLADFTSAVPAALASGLLVATMEELIFRGVMLAALVRLGGWLGAAGVTAAYYAILHFVKNDLRPAGDEVKWYSGFSILSDGLDYLMTETRLDALLALFCAGLFLAVVRWIRRDGLMLCIGIHAGWVLVIKLARRYTNPDPHKPLSFLVSPYDQVIGYGAAGWIILVLALTAYVAWRRRPARAMHS
ncbi:CPBP family intramembrane glutamic endopeptidase [Methylolobus aquaticus]